MTVVAFLRGINLGGRRVTSQRLREPFEAIGLREVSTFLASGNVVFEPDAEAPDLADRIEAALQDALGYEVLTFLRTGDEISHIVDASPFEPVPGGKAKPQVAMLRTTPSEGAAGALLEHATAIDHLELAGSELYWLPERGVSGTELDFGAIERLVGPTTVRTVNTLSRIRDKFL